MAKNELKDEIYCARCNKEMKLVLLPNYEYEDGYLLRNVAAYRCLKCGKTFFTEEQAKDMESRTKDTKEYIFGFERKLMISGKSLVVTIPYELAEHLNVKQGQKVKIFPIAKEGLIIRKV